MVFEEGTLVIPHETMNGGEKADLHGLTRSDICFKCVKHWLSGLPYYTPWLDWIIREQLENDDNIMPIFYKGNFQSSLSVSLHPLV